MFNGVNVILIGLVYSIRNKSKAFCCAGDTYLLMFLAKNVYYLLFLNDISESQTTLEVYEKHNRKTSAYSAEIAG